MSKSNKSVKKVEEKPAAEIVAVTGSLDLKESLEMVVGLDVLLDGLTDIVADGEIDWKDGLTGLKLLNKFSVFSTAAKNASLIPDELKDLDEDEMVILAKNLYPLLKKIKAVVLKIKAM